MIIIFPFAVNIFWTHVTMYRVLRLNKKNRKKHDQTSLPHSSTGNRGERSHTWNAIGSRIGGDQVMLNSGIQESLKGGLYTEAEKMSYLWEKNKEYFT